VGLATVQRINTQARRPHLGLRRNSTKALHSTLPMDLREETMQEQMEILLVEDDPRDVRLTMRELQAERLNTRVETGPRRSRSLDFLFCKGEYSQRSGRSPSQIGAFRLEATQSGWPASPSRGQVIRPPRHSRGRLTSPGKRDMVERLAGHPLGSFKSKSTNLGGRSAERWLYSPLQKRKSRASAPSRASSTGY